MEAVIFAEVLSSLESASLICPEEAWVSVLNVRIWSATTAKPLPASPALAASMEALSASRFVWFVIFSIVPVSCFTISNSWLKSCKTFSSSVESSDMVREVFTRLFKSSALTLAWDSDFSTSFTISPIRDTTFSTCSLISEVIWVEEVVLF